MKTPLRRLLSAAVMAVFLFSGTAHAWRSQITTGSCGASPQIIALDLGLFKNGGAGVIVTFSSGASATAAVQVTGGGTVTLTVVEHEP
jgi:hypothetical protein